MIHRDLSPGMVAEAHLTEMLDRHSVAPTVPSIAARRALKGLNEEELALRKRQSELLGLGEERAVADLEDAIDAVRNAQQVMRRGA